MKSVAVYSVQVVKDGAVKADIKEADAPEKAVPILREFIGSSHKEHVVLMMLDSRHHVVGLNLVSLGTLTASLIHPREVFQPAILLGAASVIVCHNHPSGDPQPSPEDCDITRRLVRAGEILGIPLVDHIVLGESAFFSFRERGLLGK